MHGTFLLRGAGQIVPRLGRVATGAISSPPPQAFFRFIDGRLGAIPNPPTQDVVVVDLQAPIHPTFNTCRGHDTGGCRQAMMWDDSS